MKKAARWIALVLILCILLPLGACAKPAASVDPAGVFLGYLERAEYARIYALLDPLSKASISLAELSDRYNAVYDAIGVTGIDGEIVQRENIASTRQRVYITLNMTSSKLTDPLQVGITLDLIYVDDQWYLEWTPSMILSGLEEGGRVAFINLTPNRGEIFDAGGNLLATNDHAVSVYVQTDEVQDLDTLVRIAAPICGLTETSIRQRVLRGMGLLKDEPEDADAPTAEPTATPMPTATPAPGTTAAPEAVEVQKRSIVLRAFPEDGLTEEQITALTEVPGLKIDTDYLTTIRSYPYRSLGAHLIGYTGYIMAEDLEKAEYAGLSTDTIIGKSGLERAYDEKLRGSQGYELALYNADGEKTQILASQPAQDGEDLWLTMDVGSQELAEALLYQYLGTEMSGTVVVLDYETGEVIAAAAYPTYDLNLFSFALSAEDSEYLYSTKSRSPMFNRITQGLYPPGSVIKPFVGGQGLDTEAITVDYAFNQIYIDKNAWHPNDSRWVYPDIRRVQRTPDPMNLRNALIYSDNIFFAYVALTMGEDNYRALMSRLRFGESLPFDLPVATSRVSNEARFGSMKLLADSGYGQGEMLITPLQMATIFSSLANNGTAMQPYLVGSRRVVSGHSYLTLEETQPKVYTRDVLSEETLGILDTNLKAVIRHASDELYHTNLGITGKTGTAQIGAANEKEIAWLICYNTLGTKKRLVCVTLETPANEGSFRYQLAIPFFQAIAGAE